VDPYPIFDWLENTPLADAIKDSTWLFPAIESVHLLALALLGGAILMLDLRLLGVGLTGQTPAQVERGARPWLIAAILTMIATGSLIGVSEATKLLDRHAFWVKMAALALALAFTFAVRNPRARRDASGWPARAIASAPVAAIWIS